MAIRPLCTRLKCEKRLGLNRSFVKYKKLPQISEATLGANATQILALHFSLRRVSLPCVRSTQGKKPPAMRVDDTDAMQQNSFPSRMVIVQVAGREGKENTMAQHLMQDHVHMLVSIPPKIAVSSFMGYLKGKSSLLMFDKHANLKYKFGNRKFWAEGYYVSTVGLNEATIAKYIREQEAHDIALDKLSVKEYEDPFKR